MRKPAIWFLNRSNSNRAAQARKMARDWKFLIYKVVELYCPCSEIKGADQLCISSQVEDKNFDDIPLLTKHFKRKAMTQENHSSWFPTKTKRGPIGSVTGSCLKIDGLIVQMRDNTFNTWTQNETVQFVRGCAWRSVSLFLPVWIKFENEDGIWIRFLLFRKYHTEPPH